MKHFKNISNATLYWRKICGCLKTFGLRETVRRFLKEISRPVPGSRPDFEISTLTEKLAIGAAPRALEHVQTLIDKEFIKIIDLRAERKKSDILRQKQIELPVDWVPIYDDWMPKPQAFFKGIDKSITPVLSNGSGKVFICCNAGEHRAPLAGLAALIKCGHSLEEAMKIIKKARPVAEFLPVYVASLKKYYEIN